MSAVWFLGGKKVLWTSWVWNTRHKPDTVLPTAWPNTPLGPQAPSGFDAPDHMGLGLTLI